MEDTTGSAKKGLESQFPWFGDGFPISICMVLLLADCKGSGRQMKSSKLTTRPMLPATHCDVNELPRCWTRSDTQFPFFSYVTTPVFKF